VRYSLLLRYGTSSNRASKMSFLTVTRMQTFKHMLANPSFRQRASCRRYVGLSKLSLHP